MCAKFQKHSQGTSVHVLSSKSLTAKQAFDSVGYRVNSIILRERTFFAENFLENCHKNHVIIEK